MIQQVHISIAYPSSENSQAFIAPVRFSAASEIILWVLTCSHLKPTISCVMHTINYSFLKKLIQMHVGLQLFITSQKRGREGLIIQDKMVSLWRNSDKIHYNCQRFRAYFLPLVCDAADSTFCLVKLTIQSIQLFWRCHVESSK